MILSVLICTIPTRKALFDDLINSLESQWVEGVEILYNDQGGTVGSKRQTLLNQAKGDYVSFVDDDDSVSENYISSIIEATKTKPDCIGICGIMTTNGMLKKNWYISMDYHSWHEEKGCYYRHTNHLSPVKREIALQVGFPDKSHGEDYDYSMGLRNKLKTEVKIPFGIYHYQYLQRK
jgi:glycosyltransferase involved in cell wall biosynthesis